MRAWLEVDLQALSGNYDVVQAHIGPNTGIFAVVKSDAYGHGIESISRTLDAKGISGFAVITLEEAQRVRKSSLRPVLIMGYLDEQEMRDAIRQGFILSLYDLELARQFNEIAESLALQCRAHLKVETGLNRLGIPIDDAAVLLANQDRYPWLRIESVYSHLAISSDRETDLEQLQAFQKLVDRPGLTRGLPLHLCNSHGLSKFREGFFDYVRLGLALYGVESVLPGLVPTLQAKTVVMQRKRVPSGEGVSYNKLFRAPRDMDVAVIAIGYAEGLSQALTGKMNVIVNGHKRPVVGQICMNLCVIDVDGIPAERGDEVIIVGRQGDEEIRVEDLARAAGLRHHEIITRFGLSLPRVYKNVQSSQAVIDSPFAHRVEIAV